MSEAPTIVTIIATSSAKNREIVVMEMLNTIMESEIYGRKLDGWERQRVVDWLHSRFALNGGRYVIETINSQPSHQQNPAPEPQQPPQSS